MKIKIIRSILIMMFFLGTSQSILASTSGTQGFYPGWVRITATRSSQPSNPDCSTVTLTVNGRRFDNPAWSGPVYGCGKWVEGFELNDRVWGRAEDQKAVNDFGESDPISCDTPVSSVTLWARSWYWPFWYSYAEIYCRMS